MSTTRVHLIGVCGTAMATLAAMLKRKGHDVRGSDQDVYPPMSDFLASEQIPAFMGYTPDHVTGDLDLVVVGNAISRGNAELEEVLDRKIRYCSLPEAIREHFLWGARSIVVSLLYATPFLRSQPSSRFVVVTFNDRGGGGPPARPAPATPSGSHSATENPCSDLAPGDAFGENCSRRVCCPASLSIFRVFGSCHVIWNRLGTRISAGAPYALHGLPSAASLAGSH